MNAHSATGDVVALDVARDLLATDPTVRHLPVVTASAATRWEVGDTATITVISALLTDLANTLAADGVEGLAEVTGEMLDRWCRTSSTGHRFEPYERRAAVFTARSVLEALSTAQLGPEDLTVLLARLSAVHRRRPLFPLEHAAVRSAAHRVRCDAHLGADNRIRRMVVALAEAGGTTNEIPQVTPADIRRGNATVTFTGTRDTARRNVALTAWGRRQVLDVLDDHDPARPIAYRGHQHGTGGAPAASVSGIGRRLLNEAGLVDGDVTLESLRNTGALLAWNGRDIQPVLTVLGQTTKNAVQKAWDLVHCLETR